MPVPHERAVLGVTQAVQAFQTASMVNPSISTIRRGTWGTDGEMARDIRDGERIAAVLTVGVGIVIAVLIDDMTPVWTAVAASALMIGIYEWALATRQSTETTTEPGED